MCNCTFCQNYDKYKWAVVMECKCGCHDEKGITAHDELCCECPNALRKNNPYTDLKPAAYYAKIIQDWKDSCEVLTNK